MFHPRLKRGLIRAAPPQIRQECATIAQRVRKTQLRERVNHADGTHMHIISNFGFCIASGFFECRN